MLCTSAHNNSHFFAPFLLATGGGLVLPSTSVQNICPNMSGPRSKYWIFTLNNPTDALALESFPHASYLVYQKEKGENGTVHYQGYLETSTRVRFSQLKSANERIHWEVRRGTQAQAIEYCTKSDTRLDGPWHLGEPSTVTGQGQRRDLVAIRDAIDAGASFHDIREQHPNESYTIRRNIMEDIRDRDRAIHSSRSRPELQVYVYWGDAGTGKTRSVYDEHGFTDVYTLNTSSNGNLWFDGYEYEPVLLIDDFRGWIKFQEFLKILDIYPFRLPIKGSFDYAAWTKVYITSNHPIEDWYRDESNHHLPALRRRIHRVVHFSNDHPWLPGDAFPGIERDGDSLEDAPASASNAEE